MKLILSLLGCLLASAAADVSAAAHSYKDGDTVLEGFLALPDLQPGEKRPGVLVIHDWTGLQDYAKQRAKQLAEMGFVVFAADVYGKDVRPVDPQQCGVCAKLYKTDRTLFRKRLNLALAELKNQPACLTTETAAIGYCFGGTGVIELARSGADVRGVVSFHGGLDSPAPADGTNIKAKVLALHGADDPFVPAADVDAFIKEMNQHKVDWQMISYGGAVHTFTKAAAGNDPSKGSAYNANADRRSWEAMRQFFREVLPSWKPAS